MSVDGWIALLVLAAGLSGIGGYLWARSRAPKQSVIDELQVQLQQAQTDAQQVQANVTGHFEQSAVLFGQLAKDYREFVEHFSASAQTLGLSEVRARELLEQADRPLLGHSEEIVSLDAEGDSTAPSEAVQSETEGVEAEGVEAEGVEAEVGDSAPSEADPVQTDPQGVVDVTLPADAEAVDRPELDSTELDPVESAERKQQVS